MPCLAALVGVDVRFYTASTHAIPQSTGVEAADEVGSSFNQFKLQRAPYDLRYIIYVIKDGKIVIEKQGAREKTWDDFTGDLPDDDCRYAVIDVEFETDDGRPTSKIVFLSWCVRRRACAASALPCALTYVWS